MAFLSPNVTAILKFLKIFQLLFSIQTVVFPTITKKTLVADTLCPAPKKLDLVNSVVETAATLFLCLADIAPGSSSQAFP